MSPSGGHIPDRGYALAGWRRMVAAAGIASAAAATSLALVLGLGGFALPQAAPADARLAAVALTALVDGLWLELSLGNAPFSVDEAEALAEKWLDSFI